MNTIKRSVLIMTVLCGLFNSQKIATLVVPSYLKKHVRNAQIVAAISLPVILASAVWNVKKRLEQKPVISRYKRILQGSNSLLSRNVSQRIFNWGIRPFNPEDTVWPTAYDLNQQYQTNRDDFIRLIGDELVTNVSQNRLYLCKYNPQQNRIERTILQPERHYSTQSLLRIISETINAEKLNIYNFVKNLGKLIPGSHRHVERTIQRVLESLGARSLRDINLDAPLAAPDNHWGFVTKTRKLVRNSWPVKMVLGTPVNQGYTLRTFLLQECMNGRIIDMLPMMWAYNVLNCTCVKNAIKLVITFIDRYQRLIILDQIITEYAQRYGQFNPTRPGQRQPR